MSPINTGTTFMLPFNTKSTNGTTFMLPFNTESSNDIICTLLLIPSLIYKLLIALLTNSWLAQVNSLGLLPTNSLGFSKLLLFFLFLISQVEGANFQSVSLTNLNLSTIKPTFMSNPNVDSPIQSMNQNHTLNAQQRAQQFGPPLVGFLENYTQPTQGCSRSFVPRTPVTFPFPLTTTPGLSYTIEGVVYNTCVTKKIKSSSGVLYTKTF